MAKPTPISKQACPLSRAESTPLEKPPKSRPPVGLRDRILKSSLPQYSGPYSVGLMDIEVPACSPRTFSSIKREHKHLLKLETVLFTVYYPSAIGSGHGQSPEGKKYWSRATWLPRPRIETTRGYGSFASLPSWFTLPFVWLTTAFTKIPAWRNARIAGHWPNEQNSREAGGYEVKNQKGEPPPGEPDSPCFPLMIFSHGLGGTKTTYSSICGEFASYGFVVVSLEHRDGSGPRTFINVPNRDEDSDNSGKDQRKGFSKMDYVFPKDNPMDTSPGNEKGPDHELRTAQLQLRLAEIEEAYHVMKLIHAGRGDEVAAANLRWKDENVSNQGGSSRGLKGVDWKAWESRFHLRQVTMLGHSFGGATTIEVLRYKNRFNFIGQGIIYDVWGVVIQRSKEDPKHRIDAPMLGIMSEAFMYWPDNLDSIMSLCREAKEHDALVWLMTVRGSIHLSQSDFAILYPRIASLALKMTVNSQRALDLNINASLEFLRLVMPATTSSMNRGTDEGLLDVQQLEKIPSHRRPTEEWTGFRLRIPHEAAVRLTPHWIRRHRAKKLRAEGKVVPRDPKGKALVGLQDLEGGDEVWMHVAPTKEDLERHGLGGSGLEADSNHADGDGDGDGIVDTNRTEGMSRSESLTVEQSYMERE
ncbi:platelet-activating factor acetylhydrolase, isoform II-domain-containing protein [Calycina marina]|uniref:1-alkyl-2-acetylglycerophosphocholine esterase n=1 Tax=Calycina marina TaxID=1763456 RepID=A0A9P8CCY5_9HELO|nr:platelet-activating factor acetylhydrolase, isoform II-domain-containing protein [Calycina marina]